MRKIKILHFITRLDRGGSPDNTLLTLIGLHGAEFDITLAYGVTREPPAELMERARGKGVRFIFLPTLVRGISPVKDLITLLVLFSLIKKGKFDIIHTHASKAGILGRIAAKWARGSGYRPILVHSPHGHIFYGYYGPVLSHIFLWMERQAARLTDRIVTLTERGIDEHLKFKVAGDRSKFTAIHSGVEIRRIIGLKLDNPGKKKELALPENAKIVGSAGRLEGVKGYKYFIDAAAKVLESFPGCIFLLSGDGSLLGKLKKQIADLRLEGKFRLLGWREDIDEITSLLDVFVLPSLNEGMGRVLVEAMAFGKPAVATRVGGVPSVVIDGETGVLVPPKDPEVMAKAIISLLNDPEKAKKMGEAGRKRAELFSAEVMIDKTKKLYEELLRDRA